MLLRLPHRQLLVLLGALLAIEFVILAIAPHDRKDWMLENALVVLFVGFMVGTYRKLTLSRISYLLIFVFLSVHMIGAHYTYALFPCNDWFRAVTGGSLNELLGWERNNFDRVVHFLYGLLLAYPVR